MSGTVIQFRPKVRRIPIRVEHEKLSFGDAVHVVFLVAVASWSIPIALAFWLGLL